MKKGQYIICKREGCDIEFYVYPSDIKRGKRYCSQPCCKADLRIKSFGKKSPDGYGYIRVRLPFHPNAHKDGRVPEHILVMSEMLGRPLYSHEEVHHMNGVRDDNNPKNLEFMVYLSTQRATSRRQNCLG